MTELEKKFNLIIRNLDDLNKNLNNFSKEFWNSIEYNNNEKLVIAQNLYNEYDSYKQKISSDAEELFTFLNSNFVSDNKETPKLENDKVIDEQNTAFVSNSEKINNIKVNKNYNFEGLLVQKEKYSYEIVKHYGTIASGSNDSLELNSIKWNNRQAKYDLRHFSLNHDKVKTGITFPEEILNELKKTLDNINFEKLEIPKNIEYPDIDKFHIVKNYFSIINPAPSKYGMYELNLMSWYHKEYVFDFRIWSVPGVLCEKGVSFDLNGLYKLKILLEDI